MATITTDFHDILKIDTIVDSTKDKYSYATYNMIMDTFETLSFKAYPNDVPTNVIVQISNIRKQIQQSTKYLSSNTELALFAKTLHYLVGELVQDISTIQAQLAVSIDE